MRGVIGKCIAGVRMNEDGEPLTIEGDPLRELAEDRLGNRELTAAPRVWPDRELT